MAKAIYEGVSGVARKVKQPFVGVSGVARKVKNGYVGVGGVARGCYTSSVPVTINIIYSGNTSGYAYVTINGTKYTKSATVTVEKGTVITAYVTPSGLSGQIVVNNTTVKSGSSNMSYNYTVNSNINITLDNYATMYGTSAEVRITTV